MCAGSIGMLPSASLDANNKGLYEPSHGSAPDIAGQDLANPVGTILSAALLLIDETQGRLGTTTALLRRGPLPAAKVPAALMVPFNKGER